MLHFRSDLRPALAAVLCFLVLVPAAQARQRLAFAIDGAGSTIANTEREPGRSLAADFGDELEAPMFDCNGNGIEDAVDIAIGASSDADRNGIPDECEDDGATGP